MSDLAISTNGMSAIESVLVNGDLSKLTPDQRVQYYQAVCRSLDLNPLTRPFDYITLSGKLTLYARKDAAEQLRNKRQISIDKPEIRFEDDWIIVTVCAHIDGRTDSDVGAVKKTDMQGNFGNALMKAVTKAKRRVTLSICGLGMLDETEIETIPDAQPVVVTETGEIVNGNGKPATQPIALTMEQALAMKTPKSTLFSALDAEQLNYLIAKSKDAREKQAAEMILAQMAIESAAEKMAQDMIVGKEDET